MIVKEIKSNYHSYLSEVKDSIDPVIAVMRSQSGQAWRGKAWLGPLKELSAYVKHLKLLTAISWTSLPIIGPIIVGYAANKYGTVPMWGAITGGVILAVVIYIFYVKWYEGKMATIGDARFHVEAMKAKRPKEYEKTWSHFVKKSDFTFNGLYEFVNATFSQHGDPDAISHVVAYSQGQHEFMQTTIADLQTTIEMQASALEELESEISLSEKAISYLVGLIKKINTNLYRITNEKFTLYDMDFVTGFSLYKKEENKLKLWLDKGTSGAIKGDLDLTDDVGKYAAVDAANSLSTDAFINNPYPGRYIVAFKMNMLQGETWIWCFHFDDDDDRALSLTLSSDIIEARQIRRLIHAFCLILHKYLLEEGRESDLDAATS